MTIGSDHQICICKWARLCNLVNICPEFIDLGSLYDNLNDMSLRYALMAISQTRSASSMSRPKKVAIIGKLAPFFLPYTVPQLVWSGAGPSGLVAAKTLLCDFPAGTFTVTIFEKRSHVGGIWPIGPDDRTTSAPPDMPTNISKHVMNFADLAWDSVFPRGASTSENGVPTYPRAHEVGQYLRTYAQAYIPHDRFRFNCEVVHIAEIDTSHSWHVKWRHSSSTPSIDKASTGTFDYVIVGSGFLGNPQVVEIDSKSPKFRGKIIHSSNLHDISKLLPRDVDGGKIVVVGGSFSGAEAAAKLAFHFADAKHSPQSSFPNAHQFSVHHITPRPFWSMPPYNPINSYIDSRANPRPKFLPLDFITGDLSRRTEEKIAFSPTATFAPDAAMRFNTFINSLLGSNQSKLGNGTLAMQSSSFSKPPWIVISTTYAEFVRSEEISVILGHLTVLEENTVKLRAPEGNEMILDNVVLVVMATGFTPHPTVSFLSEETLRKLEYDSQSLYAPLKLTNFSTTHPATPSLGFVGFYKGAYWGVMEQQSRFLGMLWSDQIQSLPVNPAAIVESIEKRGQTPMGDYVGLMESFSSVLGVERVALSDSIGAREGPAIPARYTWPSSMKAEEITKTITSVVDALTHPTLFTAPAVFRALQGKWRLERELKSNMATYPSGTFNGEANMYPRSPTAVGYVAEFLYVENGELTMEGGLQMAATKRYAYRLTTHEPQHISAWFIKPKTTKEVDYLFHDILFAAEESVSEIWGEGWRANGLHHLCGDDHYDTEYWFKFQGIEILEWGIAYAVKGPKKDYWTKARYRR